MIFLIDEIETKYEVIIYENIKDLTSRVEWQDIFEGKSIIIDQNGTEYEWDASKKEEIGIVYDYTMRRTSRQSDLLEKCLNVLKSDKNLTEFEIQKH
jgi:hypothetical protein